MRALLNFCAIFINNKITHQQIARTVHSILSQQTRSRMASSYGNVQVNNISQNKNEQTRKKIALCEDTKMLPLQYVRQHTSVKFKSSRWQNGWRIPLFCRTPVGQQRPIYLGRHFPFFKKIGNWRPNIIGHRRPNVLETGVQFNQMPVWK